MQNDEQNKLELGHAARRKGQLTDARTLFQGVVDTARNAANKALLAAGLRGLGQIARVLESSSDALEYYAEATDVARELDDKLLLASTVRHLADVNQDIGNLDAAEPLYLEALDVYRGDPRTSSLELANALRPLALLREKQSDQHEAKSLWQEAKSLYEASAVDAGVAECRDAINRCS